MPSIETLDQFITMVEANHHDLATEQFYTADSTMQENQASPRRGKHLHVANELKILSRVKSITSRCIRPVFVNGDYVAIRWVFRFEWKNDTVTEMEEMAHQRWEGEYIAEETFFYDPAQRVAK